MRDLQDLLVRLVPSMIVVMLSRRHLDRVGWMSHEVMVQPGLDIEEELVFPCLVLARSLNAGKEKTYMDLCHILVPLLHPRPDPRRLLDQSPLVFL